MSEVRYHLHNTTRSQATRTQRALNPAHGKTVLLLGGGTVRVVRGRPVVVGESTLRRMHAELKSKIEQGLVKVTTLRGDLVDLDTLQVVRSLPPDPPLPDRPLDSAQNDANEGIGDRVIQYEGNLPQDEVVEPVLLGRGRIPEDIDIPRAPEEPVLPSPSEADDAPALDAELEESPDPEEPLPAPPSVPTDVSSPQANATRSFDERVSNFSSKKKRR